LNLPFNNLRIVLKISKKLNKIIKNKNKVLRSLWFNILKKNTQKVRNKLILKHKVKWIINFKT